MRTLGTAAVTETAFAGRPNFAVNCARKLSSAGALSPNIMANDSRM